MTIKIVTDSGFDITQEEAEAVVSIHITSKHSATYNAALPGKKTVDAKLKSLTLSA